MDRPDIPLNGLRAFEVALRQGSFTRAAIELRVTQAAVSHQIARLEDRLGAKLFLRTSGGLVPTDEGRDLYPVLEHGLDAIARANLFKGRAPGARLGFPHKVQLARSGDPVLCDIAVHVAVPSHSCYRQDGARVAEMILNGRR